MAEDHIYLTVAEEKRQPENDGYVAVISYGHPQYGDKHCTVLSVKVVQDTEQAKEWYRRMKIERPWEERN